jgi:hypothetical protein
MQSEAVSSNFQAGRISRAFPMMLCPPEAAEKVVFFGENDFNIFAPGVHLHGKCLNALPGSETLIYQ